MNEPEPIPIKYLNSEFKDNKFIFYGIDEKNMESV